MSPDGTTEVAQRLAIPSEQEAALNRCYQILAALGLWPAVQASRQCC